MKPTTIVLKLPFLLLAGLLLLTLEVGLGAADSLPPVKDSQTPSNLAELWSNYDPRQEPLANEVVKEWEQDGVVCRVIRYQVGIFKDAPAKVAAFYAFPKGGKKLPAILELHGGGQSANLESMLRFAQRGYAGLSLNWGGNKLNFGRSQETYTGPQTDWGKLDATHPPQRNKVNHFVGAAFAPDEFTLDSVESPRNSNWFIVLIAARRALTFLEQQPEVDPARLGVCGHSMGGKLTTDLAGIDNRVKVAVPSCGGSGDTPESQTELPGRIKAKPTAIELACVSDNAYIPRISCPVLWLSPTNDFHAHIDNMAWNWRNVPDRNLRFSIAPHLNHRHTDEHAITQFLWFEQHLKGAFTIPATPQIQLNLKAADGVPVITVTPDESKPVSGVDIYYSVDPHALTRFWRDARAEKVGQQWKAACPVLSVDQPIYAYANVIYDLPDPYRIATPAPGQERCDKFVISSRVLSAMPSQLQAAGVKASDKPERMIDDGSRGWHDWYRVNWGHPPLWSAHTRKLKDPKWRGPDGAKLLFEIKTQTDNALVVKFTCNEWGAFAPGKPAVDYTVAKELKGSPDWQAVTVSLGELSATDLKINAPLANWQTVCEVNVSPQGEIVQDGKKINVTGRPWQGPREIRNLHWEGGEVPR